MARTFEIVFFFRPDFPGLLIIDILEKIIKDELEIN